MDNKLTQFEHNHLMRHANSIIVPICPQVLLHRLAQKVVRGREVKENVFDKSNRGSEVGKGDKVLEGF